MAKASAVMNGVGIYADFIDRDPNGKPVFKNKEFTHEENNTMIERVKRAIPPNGTGTEQTANYTPSI